jgi:hypothetical protein
MPTKTKTKATACTECGTRIVATIGGKDVTQERLCLPHFVMRHGHLAVNGRVTLAA